MSLQDDQRRAEDRFSDESVIDLDRRIEAEVEALVEAPSRTAHLGPDVLAPVRPDLVPARADAIGLAPAPAAPARLPALVARLNPLRWMRARAEPVDDGRMPSPLVGLAKGFGLAVALPTAIVGLYLFAIAADQYIVEARFAVRGLVEPLASPTGMVALIPVSGANNNNQDGFIVANYIDSLPMVRAANEALDLKHMFSRGETDFLTRFDVNDTPEGLLKYWRQRVRTRIDAISGIITLDVRAFTPEDGLALSRFVLQRAETLVNDISRRAREDMIARNQEEVIKSEARLRKAHLSLQEFRNRWGIIDPAKSVEATLTTLVGLRREKLKFENDLQVLRASLDERSRSVQTIVASLKGVDQQIAELQSELTSDGVTKATNATQAILEYEGHMIERMIAEKIYDSTRGLADRARVAAEKQQVYLTTFVPPSLPEDSLYPKRWSTLLTLAFCFIVLWSIGSLVAAGVRDHRV